VLCPCYRVYIRFVEFSAFFLSFLAIMSFLGKKVVFSRLNREELRFPSRNQTRIFGALAKGVQKKTEVEQKKMDGFMNSALDKGDCVLEVLGNETILKVLLSVNDSKYLMGIWEWAKKNVNVGEVWDRLVNNTNKMFPGRLRCGKQYYSPEKMMLIIKGESQYFLIKQGTEFNMARIELEDVPREWGGFKLWIVPQEDNKILIEVVGTLLKLGEGDKIINMLSQEELQNVVTYQVMSYLEKIWRNDMKDIMIKIRMNGKVRSISPPKELKGTIRCAVDSYRKRWVAVKQNNNEMIWARIDWRNKKYYVSTVEEMNNQFKFIIQNHEINQPDQLEDQQLKDDEIKRIIANLATRNYGPPLDDAYVIEVKLTKAKHERVEILKRIWNDALFSVKKYNENECENKLKIIRMDGTPLYFQLQKDLTFETAKLDVFPMKIPEMDWNLDLIVMKRVDEPIQVQVVSMKHMVGSDNQGMKMENRVKNAVQTYMRKEQGEYGEIYIIMKINGKVISNFVSPEEPTLVAEMVAINNDCDTVKYKRRVSESDLITVTNGESETESESSETESESSETESENSETESENSDIESKKNTNRNIFIKPKEEEPETEFHSTEEEPKTESKKNSTNPGDLIKNERQQPYPTEKKPFTSDDTSDVEKLFTLDDTNYTFTLYDRNYVKFEKDQNDYRPKCIFVLLKVIFLLAILGALVSFYCKNHNFLQNDS
jgi:hypothetical protein